MFILNLVYDMITWLIRCYRMPSSYAITTAVFIGLVVILSASRAKRSGKMNQTFVGNSEKIKQSPD